MSQVFNLGQWKRAYVVTTTGHVSLNPDPLTLAGLNAISIRNKGQLLANIVASTDLDIFCLTLVYTFLTLVFPSILLYVFLPTTVLTVPDTVRWW